MRLLITGLSVALVAAASAASAQPADPGGFGASTADSAQAGGFGQSVSDAAQTGPNGYSSIVLGTFVSNPDFLPTPSATPAGEGLPNPVGFF